MRDIFIAALIGYLLGNIQAGYLLGKLLKKVDIRTLGQGNAGASNAVESLGWKFGVLVALIDILKGVAAILLVKSMFSVGFNKEGALLLYTAGYFAILGHIYPFYMKFKGGKGTATLIGILLGMNPVYGIIAMFILAGVTFATDYIAIGTLSLLFYILFMTIFKDLGLWPVMFTLAGGLLSIWLHLPNFRRIQNGQETRLSKVLHRKKEAK
ncbi:glycerol-3-phosphate acyltransferase [Proteiniclasticum sp. SCR006]|uniref:Glycerol-3-phosphate acyltransferase n=1 Tax=Proteiniclasticum aestuarii TaxID=2817862 RepID=A0A939KI45_9CLOT|nr:glycerol-3-phosphate acyltransferase [Proteiniclasticum aestuarii]MBO1266249.1 glycerol-3-phosphate acyltransferase [Proteiniclasticum aestuarii]